MKRSSVTIGLLFGLSMAGVLYLSGCMFPTTDDINDLTEANHDFVSGEHKGIVEAFTAQHELQNPDLSPELQAIVGQYNLLAGQLRELADKTSAKGLDVTETDLWAMTVAAFPGLAGVGLWLRNSSKPSRSAEKVSKLESDVTESNKKLTILELALATAAKAGESIPKSS